MKALYLRAWVCVAVVGLFSGATLGIPLVYEEGPNAGQAYSDGPVTIKMNFFDMGTAYEPLANPGDMVTGNTVLEGIAAVNNLPGQSPATGAVAGIVDPASPEDSWAIARVTLILDPAARIVWSEAGKGHEITAMFYGEQDFAVEQMDAANQRIAGVALYIDFYMDAARNYDSTLGSAGRTGPASYNTVTDGTLILATRSVPGHINLDGVGGGLATEFEARFNASSLTGDGEAYVALTGGEDMAQFDHDPFAPLAAGLPAADLRLQWDTFPATIADWLVTGNDPVSADVPEPASLCLIALGAGLALRRRGR